ncbi:hypothetical protein SAMN06297387_12844 [Streptomyces zhaozhouensis]|uniref:Uncharacterized protein n=1 Tax=Streptomyces zhaozhouensis TaxID=1300267 RepID=A0A286E820_9ACTN|nr:hypothetical protein [Streptomyces zhaozhouensis]SOD67046.1 hypothetical protein SAMN06297387_12844 [Streptomyces zhaozhouensis]
MKRRKAYYAIWSDGTRWLGWEKDWVNECFAALANPNSPIVAMQRVIIHR